MLAGFEVSVMRWTTPRKLFELWFGSPADGALCSALGASAVYIWDTTVVFLASP